MYHIDSTRVDSALSLPLVSNSHSPPSDTAVESHRVVIHDLGPWSQVNTRLEHDAAAVHHPQGNTHVLDDADRPVLRSSRIRNGLTTVDSALNLPLFDAEAHADYISPLCTHQPSPPIIATPSHLGPIPGGESCFAVATIRCGQCRAEFTGTYRRGNLARHVRQKHTWRNRSTYPCTIAGCNKSFARSDARSKHAQKQHSDLCPEPIRRGKTQKAIGTIDFHENDSTSSFHHGLGTGPARDDTGLNQPPFGACAAMGDNNAYYDATPRRSQTVDVVSLGPDTGTISVTEDAHSGSSVADHVSYIGHWAPEASQAYDCEGDKAHQAYLELHQNFSLQLGLHRSTATTLCIMHAMLGTVNFVEFVGAYFTRWESIVQYMRDTKSAAYPLYSHGLHDLYDMVRNIINVASIPSDTTTQQYRERQPHGTSHAGSYHISGAWSNSDTWNPLAMSSSLDVQLSNSGSGPDPTIRTTTNRTSKRPENPKLNCPRFKWFKKHGGPRPCHGCQEMTVAKVRHHCNRTSHHRRPSFAKQCRTCQRDFIDAQAYQAHTSTRPACDPRPQARGDITAWVRLYLAYYPDAVRVVSPYDGDDDYLPDDMVARCRLPPVATVLETGASSRSFLDQQRQQSSNANNRGTTAGQVAVDFMVQDAMSLINQGESAQPPHNTSPYEDDARTVAQFFEVLQCGPSLTHQQLSGLVNRTQAATRRIRGLVEMIEMAEAVISVYHTSEQRLQVEHHNRFSADSIYQPSYLPQQHLHPADAGRIYGYEYLPTSSSVYYNPTATSTQPSSQGFDFISSAYVHSTDTRPSSVQSPADPILHSPFASPYPYRRPSVSFETSPYSPSQQLPHDPESSREGHHQGLTEHDPNMMASCIDPVFLQQPCERSDSQDDELGRHVWHGIR